MLTCHRCLTQAGNGLKVRGGTMRQRRGVGSIVPVMMEDSVGVCLN